MTLGLRYSSGSNAGRQGNKSAVRPDRQTALADIDDIDQLDASFGELIQTSLIYQPSQVTMQTESSSSPMVQGTPVPAQGEADSPGLLIPEVIHVVSKNNKNQSPHAGVPVGKLAILSGASQSCSTTST